MHLCQVILIGIEPPRGQNGLRQVCSLVGGQMHPGAVPIGLAIGCGKWHISPSGPRCAQPPLVWHSESSQVFISYHSLSAFIE